MASSMDIGQILVAMGACTWDQVRRAAERQLTERHKRLGELLCDEGVSTSDVQRALETQRKLARTSSSTKLMAHLSLLDTATDRLRETNQRVDALVTRKLTG